MKIGFTGTRRGMTLRQLRAVERLLEILHSTSELHHGDCEGADAQVHDLLGWRVPVVVHPPTDDTHRAWCSDDHTTVLAPKPFLTRNRDIVDQTELLVAAPDGPERIRSGTWSTVRYALRTGRPVLVVLPDGSTVGGTKLREVKSGGK